MLSDRVEGAPGIDPRRGPPPPRWPGSPERLHLVLITRHIHQSQKESDYALSEVGTNGHPGQPVLPRSHDVRRLRQPRPRGLRSASSTEPWTRGSILSTPPTSTPTVSLRRSSAKRSRAAATMWCSRPRSTPTWVRTPTSAATPGAGSSPRSRTRSVASRPTTSTSTRCTGPIRPSTSRKPSRR